MSDFKQDKSFNYSRFSEFCLHKNELPPETRHTVEVLLKVAHAYDYHQAERILLKRTQLELEDCNISDLTPLASFKNLTHLWLYCCR